MLKIKKKPLKNKQIHIKKPVKENDDMEEAPFEPREEQRTMERLVEELMECRDVNYIIKPAAFTRMCGTNKSASDVLARIFYWMRPEFVKNKGQTQASYKYGRFSNSMKEPCLVKSLEEIAEETQVGKTYSMSRIYKFLEDEGFIETEVKRAKGHPATHIRINWEVFLQKFLIAQNEIQKESGKMPFRVAEINGILAIVQEKDIKKPPSDTKEA